MPHEWARLPISDSAIEIPDPPPPKMMGIPEIQREAGGAQVVWHGDPVACGGGINERVR